MLSVFRSCISLLKRFVWIHLCVYKLTNSPCLSGENPASHRVGLACWQLKTHLLRLPDILLRQRSCRICTALNELGIRRESSRLLSFSNTRLLFVQDHCALRVPSCSIFHETWHDINATWRHFNGVLIRRLHKTVARSDHSLCHECRLSVWKNLTSTGRIFLKKYIGDFYWNRSTYLVLVKIGQKWQTLRKDIATHIYDVGFPFATETYNAKFVAFTTILTKSRIFRNMTPCQLLNSARNISSSKQQSPSKRRQLFITDTES
jgi:hypothetical protein